MQTTKMQRERHNKKKKSTKCDGASTTTNKSKTNQQESTSTNNNPDAKEFQVSIDSNKQAKEIFDQLKDTAEKLKLEIKAKLDAADAAAANNENEDELKNAAAADASRVKEILEKAILEDEGTKSTSKSPVVAPINVTLDESQEKKSIVNSKGSCESPVNEVKHSRDSSTENCAEKSEKATETGTTTTGGDAEAGETEASTATEATVTAEAIHDQSSSSSSQVLGQQTEAKFNQSNAPTDSQKSNNNVNKSKESNSTSTSTLTSTSNLNLNSNSNSNSPALASFFDRKNRPLTSKLTTEQAVKSVSTCSNDQEKVQALAKKLSDTNEQVRSLEFQMRNQEKIITQLIKEKESLQGEHNRTLLVRSRLENVCRELQRQNRAVKEEALAKIKEEEEKRREVASKFQGTLNEVLHLVQENQGRNDQLKAENLDLAGKLKALMSHYELWEASVQKLIQQKEIECKLLAAKMAHSNAIAEQEREHSLNEKEILFAKIAELQEKGILMEATESHLKEEIAAYTGKYDEFQKILGKSNETFGQFKKDMEKMSKQTKKMEKEVLNWKNKFESCSKELLHVTVEKQNREKELIQALSKIETLQKLCRALQARNSIETTTTATTTTTSSSTSTECGESQNENQSVTCSDSQS